MFSIFILWTIEGKKVKKRTKKARTKEDSEESRRCYHHHRSHWNASILVIRQWNYYQISIIMPYFQGFHLFSIYLVILAIQSNTNKKTLTHQHTHSFIHPIIHAYSHFIHPFHSSIHSFMHFIHIHTNITLDFSLIRLDDTHTHIYTQTHTNLCIIWRKTEEQIL